MSKPGGNPQHLVASHPGNRSAERSSAFARRNLAQDPEVRELADAILAAPYAMEMDEVGAIEIGKVLVLIDRIDADLAERGLTRPRSSEARSLLTVRRQMSAQLERWLALYGMTPASRAELMRNVATGGLAAEIARRRAELREDQP